MKNKNAFRSGLQTIFLCLMVSNVIAQNSVDGGLLKMDELFHRVNSVRYYNDHIEDKPKDFKLPDNAQGYLSLRAKGADGGYTWGDGSGCRARGGEGATIIGNFKIGTGDNMIPPGSTIRFLIGLRGDSRKLISGGTDGSGGGGGTGILYKAPNQNEWTLMIVAGGGGGGAGKSGSGKPGEITTSGSHGSGTQGGAGGTNGENGTRGSGGSTGFAGGGLFGELDDYSTYRDGSPGWPDARYIASEATYYSDGSVATPLEYGYDYSKEPLGGVGGSTSTQEIYNETGGGWGFGAGGCGEGNAGGGGGGGYSGGGSGGATSTDRGGGGGGGSYISTIAVDAILIQNVNTCNPADGFVDYRISSSATLFGVGAIKFAYNTNKCIDDYGSNTSNGNNIQTYTCTGNPNQTWSFHPTDRTIRSKLNTAKCLDLTGGNTSNGSNIQLWDCTSDNANQKWVYNGLYKTIHSGKNSDKCFDANGGSQYPNSNVNLQLWDCNYFNNNQKWNIDGATTVSDVSIKKHIVPVSATGFAVHSHTGAESGSNIQLWTKDNTNTAEQWYFDGLAIKMRDHRDLCIDLSSSNTSNGNNIQLYTCNGTNAQKWLYDGMTQSIRSVVNPDKCMQIEFNTDGIYGKRSNVQIHDCNGSEPQLFLIQE